MRVPNKAIKREEFPASTIENVVSLVNKTVLYSNLDSNTGLHQIELSPESSDIKLFSLDMGLFRYKSLSFEITSVHEIFHQFVRENIYNIAE